MKTPIEILLEKGLITELSFNRGHYEYRFDDPQKMAIAFEAYADQFKSKWIPVNDFPLEDTAYYLAIRYGIHLYPDIVNYSNGQFYSTKLGQIVNDVAYLMPFTPHPFGNGEVIDFQPSKNI